MWIREYMIECVENSNPLTSLLYELLISRIIIENMVDLSKFKPTKISSTYDTRTFSSMGYTLVDKKWHKKEALNSKIDAPEATRVSQLYFHYVKGSWWDQKSHFCLGTNMLVLWCLTEKILQSCKDTSIDVGKLNLNIDGFKKRWNAISQHADQASRLYQGGSWLLSQWPCSFCLDLLL